MDARLHDRLEGLAQATTLEALQAHVTALRDHFDTDHLIYHAVNPQGGQYAALTYSEDWVNEYLARDYQRIDPVVQGAFCTFQPVDWKALDWSSRAARTFFGEAVAAGVGNQGVTVPIRSPGGRFAVFTANKTGHDHAWCTFRQARLTELILTAHFLNQKALELEEPARPAPPATPLSPREVDALSLLATGASRAEIADRLAISEHTLRVYIEGARHKLGAANTIQAVARALTQGLIVV